MSKLFSTVKSGKTKKSAFDLSHERKLSCKMGELVPIMCEELVPGDKFNIQSEVLIRLAPLVAPVMHRVNAYIHYFFVPNRLVWSEWQEFITGEKTAIPPMLGSGWGILKGSLGDHLGIPPMPSEAVVAAEISQMPFAAYQLIYNEYYRDQNLQEPVDITLRVGEILKLRNRAWEKDYFTSALPWTQKGGPSSAPLTVFPAYSEGVRVYEAGTPNEATGNLQANLGWVQTDENPGQDQDLTIENLKSSLAGIIDINDFRIAHRVQKWFERQARSGSRYTETILSHFGVNTGDARLQRPEYIGGGKTPVIISEVLNTNGNQSGEAGAENVPQGNMSGHGISVGGTNRAGYYAKEHGYIMGILSVIPKTTYQTGIHKMFSRVDKFDWFWPEFANLGEQAVLHKELFVGDDTTRYNGTFGYQSRYAEYKYKNSSVHGDFRKNLAFYHMGRIWHDSPEPEEEPGIEGTEPDLNSDFITCNTEAINNRVFAAGNTADQLWCQIYNRVKAVRPMPYYGTPTL